MTYSVVWANPILDRLADLYVGAEPADRERTAAGVEALNRRLATNPTEEGESRDGDQRVTFTPCLVVRFRVNLMSDAVRVIGVARSRR